MLFIAKPDTAWSIQRKTKHLRRVQGQFCLWRVAASAIAGAHLRGSSATQRCVLDATRWPPLAEPAPLSPLKHGGAVSVPSGLTAGGVAWQARTAFSTWVIGRVGMSLEGAQCSRGAA